jgi:hypothetical protein
MFFYKKMDESILYFDAEIEKKYNLVKEKKIPIKYIIEMDQDFYTPQEILSKYIFSKEKNLYMFYKDFKDQNQLTTEDVLIMLYFSDILKGNINLFFEIALEFIKKSKVQNINIDPENFTEQNFQEYVVQRWSNLWNSLLAKNKDDEKKLKDFYDTINNLSKITNPNEIFDSIIETTKRKVLKVRKELDDNLSLFFFDSLVCTKEMPLIIKVDESGEQLIKCFTEYIADKKINDIDFSSVNETKNSFFIFLNYYSAGEIIETYFTYRYVEREIIYNMFKDNILEPKIKTFVKEHIDKEIILENIIGSSGILNIPFNGYEEYLFVFLIKSDPLIQKFLFIKEFTIRSLKNSLKYYYKTPIETYKNKDKYFINFTVEKNSLDSFRIKYQSKSIDSKKIKDFAISLSKIIKYYNSKISFLKSLLPEGAADIKESNIFKTDKKEGSKLFKLMEANPDMYKEGIYSREICGCKTQPIIIEEEDILDYRNNLVSINGDGKEKRQVILFPPAYSSYEPKHWYTSPSTEYPYISIKKNKNIEGNNYKEFPFLLCCSKTDKLNMIYSKRQKGSSLPFSFEEDMKEAEEETLEDVKNMICSDDDNIYNKFDYLREGNALESNSNRNKNYEIKNTKILKIGKVGNIPVNLEKILSQFGTFKRIGVSEDENKGNNSFISCILRATENRLVLNDGKEKEREEQLKPLRDLYKINKESAVNYLRKTFHTLIHTPLLYQEFYDNINEIETEDSFFNPKFYTRALEEIFNVNIVTFIYYEDDVYIEDLNKCNYSIRILNENIPTVFVLCKKKNANTYVNICELIGSSDYVSDYQKDTDGLNLKTFLFDRKVTNYVKNKMHNYYVYIGDILYRAPFNHVRWEEKLTSLKKSEIIGQIINKEGKTFCINVKIGNEKISFFVFETRPLNAPIDEEIHLTTKHFLKTIIKEKGIKGEGGMFYDVNDMKNMLFIPCKDVKYKRDIFYKSSTNGKKRSNLSEFLRLNNLYSSTKTSSEKTEDDFIEQYSERVEVDEDFDTKYGVIKDRKKEILFCSQYELYKNSFIKNKEFEENKEINFETNILLQIIFFIYLSNPTPLETFITKYFVDDRKMTKKIKKLPYIFPAKNKSIRDTIVSFHEYWPDVFGNDGKIHLYKDLIRNIKLFMGYIAIKTEGLNYGPNKTLLGIFNNLSDFKKYKNNKVFSSLNAFSAWIKSNSSDAFIVKNEVNKYSKMPYFYTNDKNNYIIQGSRDGTLNSAYGICDFWAEYKVNNINAQTSEPHNYVVYKGDNEGKIYAFYDKVKDEKTFYEIFYHKNGNYSAMLLIN